MSAARAGQAAARAAGAQVPAARRDTDEVEADVRIIAATNRDLGEDGATGTFREDLFYRLNVDPDRLPPLRERREDIPLLAEPLRRRFATEMGKPLSGRSPDEAVMPASPRTTGPGNIRELENAIERAVALERSRSILSRACPSSCSAQPSPPRVRPCRRNFPGNGFDSSSTSSTSSGRTSPRRSARRRRQGEGRGAARDEVQVVQHARKRYNLK